MVSLPFMEYNASTNVLSSLELVKQAVRKIFEQKVTVVE